MKNHPLRGKIILISLGLAAVSFFLILPRLLEILLLPRITGELSLTGKELHITGVSLWSLQGSIRLENDNKPVLMIPRFELRYSPFGIMGGQFGDLFIDRAELHLQLKAGRIGLNGIPIAGKTTQRPVSNLLQFPILLDEISLKDCAVVVHTSETTARQVLFDARISLPLPASGTQENGKPGSLEIARLVSEGKHLLSLKADLKLTDKKLTAKGTATSPLVPDLRLIFAAAYTENDSLSLKAEIPEGPFAISSLEPFLSLPQGLHLRGRLLAEASFSLGPPKQHGKASLQIRQGLIELPDEKIALKGLALALVLPDLPNPHSNPDQLLSIETMDFDNLHFSDARVHFRLQDLRTILIEKSRLAWCGGHVQSGSLTLSTENKEVTTILSCDRLNISQVLNQTGISDSAGQGTLNGQIPLSLGSAGVRFENGFLFSTVGEPGRLQFNNTETLRQGLPDLDTTATLDYSLDALKDFSYNWMRLRFNTSGDALLITMQVDGKPAIPLPYAYLNGQIVKDAKGPGLQHPIQLNVNFHLPSAEIFRFGRNIQTIKDNM